GDISGVDCIVVANANDAGRLVSYLTHAGARVQRASSRSDADIACSGLVRPVIVEFEASEDLLERLSPSGDARHVRIRRGKRHHLGQHDPSCVWVDGNVLRRSALLRAVAVAAGRASPDIVPHQEVEGLGTPRLAAPTVARARREGRLVLVAEDDEVNQKVILRQLDLLGYAAEVAHDGDEALRLWRTGGYAILLTDLHMPGMDGYALTECIRQDEHKHAVPDEQRLPIIALTANALRGEAARAASSGMDDYLTKPLQLHVLRAALRRWARHEPFIPEVGAPDDTLPPPAISPVVDVTVLESLVGDDPLVVRDFLSDYLDSARRLVGELRLARNAEDLRQIGAIAHKLKSSSRSVGAIALGDLCSALENACRTGPR